MPPAPVRPADLHGKVFRASREIRIGRLTRGRLRSSAWRRVFPDVYACSTLELTHALRARALVLLLLPEAVLCGRSAAVLWGVDLAGPEDDVECTVAPDYRRGTVRGVRLTRRSIPPEHVVIHQRCRVTSRVRTALDLARIAPWEEAVVALDRFVAGGGTGLAEVRAAAAELSGPGCRQVRRVAECTDGLAGSPQETRLRLLLRRHRLPRPVAQFTVRDAAGFVARVDFAWPEHRLVLEYEGRWHGESPQQVARDRERLNRLSAAGWRVVYATAEDLRNPERLIARLRRELALFPA